ncbi:hypothetical protein [Micromonospora eburnea]|uniref:PH domain-containing protein n=1 Tax=Micromonospora eburnea TaxID=227316 RepID=A0A1C6TT24_9ACTN|nr:hypothetical protein [Micromonospora eburnea]SCL44803.1 hypothetical protein GA0070604_0613 [Micromonospora eburnea]
MSLPEPAASVQPNRDGFWSRRLAALLAGGAVAAVAAWLLLGMSRADLADVRGLAWLATGMHLVQQRWRPRRTGRLVWHARVAGRDGTEPGLVARRSPAAWLEMSTGAFGGITLTVGVVSLIPDRWSWAEVGRPVLLAGLALGLGWAVFQEARFTGRLALTASGLRDGSEWYPWSEVREARLNSRKRPDGVWLRLDPGRLTPQVVGGRKVTVSDERLLAAIEHFRPRPQTLAVGLPITPPEPPRPAASAGEKGTLLYRMR